MELTEERKEQLGIGLNEANLLGVEVDPATRTAGVTVSVLTLPQVGPAPQDRRVQFRLESVGRVAAAGTSSTATKATSPSGAIG